jgi:trk system potassium uptake protein TrkA
LRRAGIEQAGCLLAITRHDNVNMMVTQVAKTVFGVPKVIARTFDPSREAVYHQFGVETICPTSLSAVAFLDTMNIKPETGQT